MIHIVHRAILAMIALLAFPAAARAADGEGTWRQQCAACHSIDPKVPSGIGPNLARVVGRKAGTLPDFAFSPAMKGAKFTWSKARLKAFLAKPQAVLPGNRMPYAGMSDAAAAAALVDWLGKRR